MPCAPNGFTVCALSLALIVGRSPSTQALPANECSAVLSALRYMEVRWIQTISRRWANPSPPRHMRPGKETTMTVTDELIQANEQFAQSFNQGNLPMPPARHVAVLTCMDARLHP